VRRGRKPGIYHSWAECEAQVKGFPAARFKKLPTESLAAAFISGTDSVSVSRPRYKASSAAAASSSSSSFSSSSSASSSSLPRPSSSRYIHQTTGRRSEESAFRTEPGSESDLIVYTDGACRSNGRSDARAGIGVYFGEKDPRNSAIPFTGDNPTNQRAELEAIAVALDVILGFGVKPGRTVVVRTDSKYSIQSLTQWMPKWKALGWVTSTGGPVKNQDIMRRVDSLRDELRQQAVEVRFEHVRGHSGDFGNEMADKLANLGIDGQ